MRVVLAHLLNTNNVFLFVVCMYGDSHTTALLLHVHVCLDVCGRFAHIPYAHWGQEHKPRSHALLLRHRLGDSCHYYRLDARSFFIWHRHLMNISAWYLYTTFYAHCHHSHTPTVLNNVAHKAHTPHTHPWSRAWARPSFNWCMCVWSLWERDRMPLSSYYSLSLSLFLPLFFFFSVMTLFSIMGVTFFTGTCSKQRKSP